MNHVYFYGAAYRDQLFGPERAARMDPAADCVRLGLPFTIHTDAPCSNIGTLQLVQAAVTRKCSVDGSVVGPEQAVSLTEALRAVTVHAAGQIGMADQLGTLEFGKLADLTILEKHPDKVDPDALTAIKVSETWVGGQRKFGYIFKTGRGLHNDGQISVRSRRGLGLASSGRRLGGADRWRSEHARHSRHKPQRRGDRFQPGPRLATAFTARNSGGKADVPLGLDGAKLRL